jgi:TPR repeat protein
MPGFSSEFTTTGEKASGAIQSPQFVAFRKATKGKNICESGRDDAFFYLGIAYLEGKGVRASIPAARKLFQRANVDNDHPAARSILLELTRS